MSWNFSESGTKDQVKKLVVARVKSDSYFPVSAALAICSLFEDADSFRYFTLATYGHANGDEVQSLSVTIS